MRRGNRRRRGADWTSVAGLEGLLWFDVGELGRCQIRLHDKPSQVLELVSIFTGLLDPGERNQIANAGVNDTRASGYRSAFHAA